MEVNGVSCTLSCFEGTRGRRLASSRGEVQRADGQLQLPARAPESPGGRRHDNRYTLVYFSVRFGFSTVVRLLSRVVMCRHGREGCSGDLRFHGNQVYKWRVHERSGSGPQRLPRRDRRATVAHPIPLRSAGVLSQVRRLRTLSF